ncbi:hypothetical protein ABEP17_17995 [Priestia flexa]|jgi:hypothetical protein|uniref:Uncharacterized protein n=1 Tax=Priestia flexa TaxID=86664 RepID=A0A8I1MJB9_9BACI|nr:hypothetical protein [Priestia flexa]MBN8253633.1 hypothetical protein [Priestia flexa]MBY6087867.1 hypothetical protein [Priestia flexa]MDW8517039.1 hypothetical protein [Priestia flexa]
MNFNNLSKSHLDELVNQLNNREFDLRTVNSASNIIHEASHYFDHLATLSGQLLLKKIYDALNDYSSNLKKDNIIDLFRTIESWNHGSFNTSTVKGISDPNYENWSYRFGKGFLENFSTNYLSKPFLFATFKYYGEIIGDIPFSIEALWETNAMWAEITYNTNLAYMLEDEDIWKVETFQIQNKYTNYIYNSELLVYSFAAHLTSNFLGEGNFYYAFKLSKALSSISLNLPYHYYSQIRRPKGSIFGGFTNVLLTYTDSLDPCAIYLTLLENIYEAKVNLLKDDLLIDLEEILAINGLPNKAVLNADILEEMNQLSINLDNAPFSKVYSAQKEHGIHMFETYGIEGGLNIHPACFIDIAAKSDSCVFQEDMEETSAYNRYADYRTYEANMLKLVKAWKENKSFDPA